MPEETLGGVNESSEPADPQAETEEGGALDLGGVPRSTSKKKPKPRLIRLDMGDAVTVIAPSGVWELALNDAGRPYMRLAQKGDE